VYVYEPIVLGWCRAVGLQESDAADVAQEVMQAVATSIDRFRREKEDDSFRGWLYGITRNKLNDWRRRTARAPRAIGGTDFHQRLHREQDPLGHEESIATTPKALAGLFRRALELIRTDFQENTWKAFWMVAVEGKSATEAAAAVGISPGAVYVAKSRVLNRLREEFSGLEEFAEQGSRSP
jgi:RNA polymerase sigma-70 factor, ECF subfamily